LFVNIYLFRNPFIRKCRNFKILHLLFVVLNFVFRAKI
jgi:hypothetical protein